MKRTFALLLFSVAASLVAAPCSVASDQKGTVIQGNKITVAAKAPSQAVSQANLAVSGLAVIYDNLGVTYPKGRYWCCGGATVSGPKAPTQVQWWEGVPFTPNKDYLLKAIVVAIGYVSGTNEVVLNLNNDENGLPGSVIQSWTIDSLPSAGTCCSVSVRSNEAGIPVTQGTQYWITATTDQNDSNLLAEWEDNDVDQTDPVPSAALCLGNLCGENNGKWVPFVQTPGLAMAVLGTVN